MGGVGGSYDYDLVVVGGGSGGLSCARQAAKLGAKVAILDFVKPSPQGTAWGLGGTCVNVGCIPKKLMHTAALLKGAADDAKAYGWSVPDGLEHSWDTLVDAVGSHIGSLNWGYRTALRDEGIDYKNELGSIVDAHTVKGVSRKKVETLYSAKYIVIAVGGRPYVPEDVPGALEHAITSDDIFWRFDPPGKTLCVGASYVALEIAGFLTGLGYDTTVAVRSILLRGFDQGMAEKVGKYMEHEGTTFKRPVVVDSIAKDEASGKLKVVLKSRTDGTTEEEEYDTVLFATGRKADTANLGLENVGIVPDAKTGKIAVDEAEATCVDSIFALGDVIDQLELTPVAIAAGRLLASRLFDGKTTLMNYTNIPTAVFTPLEYGAVGLSEEDAAAEYGIDNIEVFHTYPQVLEHTIPHREENQVYAKLIVRKADDVVIGVHYAGPNAGEVIQGLGIAVMAGATKAMFDATVGIHPTIAEEFTSMEITRASGKSALRTGC